MSISDFRNSRRGAPVCAEIPGKVPWSARKFPKRCWGWGFAELICRRFLFWKILKLSRWTLTCSPWVCWPSGDCMTCCLLGKAEMEWGAPVSRAIRTRQTADFLRIFCVTLEHLLFKRQTVEEKSADNLRKNGRKNLRTKNLRKNGRKNGRTKNPCKNGRKNLRTKRLRKKPLWTFRLSVRWKPGKKTHKKKSAPNLRKTPAPKDVLVLSVPRFARDSKGPLQEHPCSLLAVLCCMLFVCAACAWQDVLTSPSWVSVLEGLGWGGAQRATPHLTLRRFGFIWGASFSDILEFFWLFCPIERSPAHGTATIGNQTVKVHRLFWGNWLWITVTVVAAPIIKSCCSYSIPREPIHRRDPLHLQLLILADKYSTELWPFGVIW